MRVSVEMIGSGAPDWIRRRACVDVRVVLGPRLERDVEQRRGELLGPLRFPRLDGRHAVARPRRDVGAVVVEAAVAAHAAGDERLGVVVDVSSSSSVNVTCAVVMAAPWDSPGP